MEWQDVRFITVHKSSYIVGQAIKVDGGLSHGPTPALLEKIPRQPEVN
jgi:hypothetical protein